MRYNLKAELKLNGEINNSKISMNHIIIIRYMLQHIKYNYQLIYEKELLCNMQVD